MWSYSVGKVSFGLILLQWISILAPIDGKKRVVNHEPHHGAPSTSDKPYEIPISGGERNMEEIMDNPHFRYRKTDIGEDPNTWGEALNAYDKLVKSGKSGSGIPNPAGVFQPEPDLFDPWIDIPDTLAEKRRHLPDPGEVEPRLQVLQERNFKRQAPVVDNTTTTEESTDNTTTVEITAPTTTTTTTTTTTPRPTRRPIQCPTNPTNFYDPNEDILYVQDRLMANIDSTVFETAFDNCGKSGPDGRLCFGSEKECVESKKCRILVTLQNVTSGGGEERMAVTLILNDNAKLDKPFVGLAFSPDRFRGGDYLFYCIDTKNAVGDRNVALYMSYVDNSQSENMQTRRSAYLSSICMKGGYVNSNVAGTNMGCYFEVARYIEMDNDDMIDLYNTEFFQYLSFGKYLPRNGIGDTRFGDIGSSRQYFTSEKINLTKALKNPTILLLRSRFLIYLHVWFAASAFIFLMPSSSIIAKFGREVWSGQKKLACYKMPQWLFAHIRLSFISLILILCSLFVILIDLEFTWQSKHHYPKVHSIVGLVAMLIAFPASGALGWIFNFGNTHNSVDVPGIRMRINAWAHWAVGNMSYFLGIVCVVTAGKMPQALAPCMVEYFGWMHLSLHLAILWIMAVDSFKLVKMIDGRYMFQRAFFGPMVPWTKTEISRMTRHSMHEFHEDALLKMRRRVILFHFIVSFLCTFAICVLMILPTVLCRDLDEEVI